MNYDTCFYDNKFLNIIEIQAVIIHRVVCNIYVASATADYNWGKNMQYLKHYYFEDATG